MDCGHFQHRSSVLLRNTRQSFIVCLGLVYKTIDSIAIQYPKIRMFELDYFLFIFVTRHFTCFTLLPQWKPPLKMQLNLQAARRMKEWMQKNLIFRAFRLRVCRINIPSTEIVKDNIHTILVGRLKKIQYRDDVLLLHVV